MGGWLNKSGSNVLMWQPRFTIFSNFNIPNAEDPVASNYIPATEEEEFPGYTPGAGAVSPPTTPDVGAGGAIPLPATPDQDNPTTPRDQFRTSEVSTGHIIFKFLLFFTGFLHIKYIIENCVWLWLAVNSVLTSFKEHPIRFLATT